MLDHHTAVAATHFNVLIIGAGLSGIGAACHLLRESPQQSFAILESRAALGGTWDLFRYPGIRSDSDMYTLGYNFKPWKEGKAIADGPAILRYLHETVTEYGLNEKIRFQQKVVRAAWSSATMQWTVETQHTETQQGTTFTCRFLLLCSGYYRYDQGYEPTFPGASDFQGTIIHPQKWPQDFDYTGKRVVVIGSGATAVTLVPALATRAAHVTMLQRSPTYIISMPSVDRLASFMQRFLPERFVANFTRWRNAFTGMLIYQLSRRKPEWIKGFIKKQLRKELGPNFDIERHFSPAYNPWDQRLCLVPDGDLFAALREGRASVVTEQLETFTPRGIQLKSGEHLEADVIVTATGLKLLAMGGMTLEVDGRPQVLSETMAYKGAMLTGIPNMAFVVGYTNASWTLKADLVSSYVCRLLNYMDKHGYQQVTPRLHDARVQPIPLLDFTSSYVQRDVHEFPKQGSRLPFRLYQNYLFDTLMIRFGSIKDDALEFKRAPAPTTIGAALTA